MRALVSIVGVIFGLGFLAASAGANFSFARGLGTTPEESLVYGLLSGSVSGVNAVLPFPIGWAYEKGKRFAVVGGCLFLIMGLTWSLMSAIGFGASTRGALMDSRGAVTDKFASTKQALAETEARLKELPQTRLASVVMPDIEAAKQNRIWAASINCTNAQSSGARAFCKGYFELNAELAAAEEKDKLRAKIEKLRGELDTLRDRGAGSVADRQASFFAKLSGYDLERSQMAVIIFWAVLIEFGAAFVIYFSTAHWDGKKDKVRARVVFGEVLPPAAPRGRIGNGRRVEPQRLRLTG
jgi:hypothetical protein